MSEDSPEEIQGQEDSHPDFSFSSVQITYNLISLEDVDKNHGPLPEGWRHAKIATGSSYRGAGGRC